MTNARNNMHAADLQNAREAGYTNSIFAFGDFAQPGQQFEVTKIKDFGCISYYFVEFEVVIPMEVVKLLKTETGVTYIALTPAADTTDGDMVAPIYLFRWHRPTAKLTVLCESEFSAAVLLFI